MTNRYAWVSWNAHKRRYDAVLAAAILVFLAAYLGLGVALADEPPDPMVLLIRAFGTLALVLLHVILCIGPLARLSDRFSVLLYNRRHLGVTMAIVAVLHGGLVLLYFGGFGVINPVSAVLFHGRSFTSIAAFPFELLGFGALVIILLMAATSHDFWLRQLSPTCWKAMHMLVYLAYALILGHITLGSLRDAADPVTLALLGAGIVAVGGLHALTGVRELARDSAGRRAEDATTDDGNVWVLVGTADTIPDDRARVVCLAGAERVAVFKHDGMLSAVSNVCAHQLGPLGEGKVVDGCITCPWHGYQYDPATGRSPPPYTEQIPTYRLRVEGVDVYVDPRPLPPGTPVEPVPAPVVPANPEDESLFEEPTRGEQID